MRNHRIWSALTLILLAACGDGGTGPQGDPLTSVEIAAFMDAVTATTAELDPASLELDANGRFSLTQPCSLGGSIAAAGRVTEAQTQNRMTIDTTVDYRACKEGSSAGAFTLDGSLRQVGTFGFDVASETFSFQLAMTGSFDWSLDDRSGSCEIDLETSFDGLDEVSMTGTICGEPASLD